MINSLSASSAASTTQSMQGPKGPPPPPSDSKVEGSRQERRQAALSEVAEKAGMSEDEITSLRDDIRTAVQALGDTEDRALIAQTVNQVLEDNGIEPEAFKEALGDPPRGRRAQGSEASTIAYAQEDESIASSDDILSNLFSVDVEA